MPPFISKSYAATREYLSDTVLGDTGFFFHFSAYVLVNAILIAVNLLLTPDKLWFYWPLLGWGIGILAHVKGWKIGNFSQIGKGIKGLHTGSARDDLANDFEGDGSSQRACSGFVGQAPDADLKAG